MQFTMTTVWRGLTGPRYMDEAISNRSAEALKENAGITQTGGGSSSFDSGARFHGRFTVPFA